MHKFQDFMEFSVICCVCIYIHIYIYIGSYYPVVCHYKDPYKPISILWFMSCQGFVAVVQSCIDFIDVSMFDTEESSQGAREVGQRFQDRQRGAGTLATGTPRFLEPIWRMIPVSTLPETIWRMAGILLSYWEGIFSGAMLVSGRVSG